MSADKLVELFEMPSCSDPRVEDVKNPVLRDVNRMVKELEAEGVTVKRYLPSEDLSPFIRNKKVFSLYAHQRLKVLPVTVVNGEIVKVESYPTIAEIRRALGAETASPRRV